MKLKYQKPELISLNGKESGVDWNVSYGQCSIGSGYGGDCSGGNWPDGYCISDGSLPYGCSFGGGD